MKDNTIQNKLILTGITLFFAWMLGLLLLSSTNFEFSVPLHIWLSALMTAAGVLIHWFILRIRALEQQVDDLRRAVFHEDEKN